MAAVLSQIEELIIYVLLIGVGSIPVSTTLMDHTPVGAEATLGLIMIAAGVLGLIGYTRHAKPRMGQLASGPRSR